MGASGDAQVSIVEINPTQSTLHSSDPDGASGGRVNGLGRASNTVFYAASEWGGIYKSSDAGHKWVRLDAHLPTATWDVEVSPADQNRVIATSFYDGRVQSLSGINVSTNGGATWTHPSSATPPENFCRTADRREEPSAFGIAFDPENANNVYVGTNCGLAMSSDAGSTWRFVDPTPGNGANDVWDVAVHHAGTIDLCGDDGHRRSTDGGATWSTANAGGTPLPAGICSMAASPDEKHVLLAVSGTLIFETDDGGGSWNTEFANPSEQGRIPFVAVNDRPGRNFDLWFGDTSLHRAGCSTPASPAPGGTARCPASSTWAGGFTRSAGAHDDTGDLVFSKSSQGGVADCPLLMSSDGGVYFNTRTTGATCQTPRWQQPDVTPRGLWLFGMNGAHTDGIDKEELYFGNQDDGTFASLNVSAATPTWKNTDCCDSFDVAGAPNQVVYTVCCFSGGRANQVFISPAGMAAGTQITGYPQGNVPGFTFIDVIDRFGPNSYALITQTSASRRVSITTDITAGSVSWTQLGGAPANVCGIHATGPATNPTFYALAGTCQGWSTDRLFRFTGTSSSGTWQPINPPVSGTGVGFGIIAVDRADPNRLFVSVVTPAGAHMFRSTNGGTNWSADTVLDGLMAGGGTFRARVRRGPVDFTSFAPYVQPSLVSFDPSDPKTMIAGSRDAGLFLTRDGGTTWNKITDNSGTADNPVVPRPNFTYYDKECGVSSAYVGTQGRGVWRVKYGSGAPAENENCPH
jgi:photosystem II stability/assembly factor-like uncharacterized protein